MSQYDYRVIPAPTKGRKAKGIKSPEGRFANTIEIVMNDMSVHGWEFLRAETLPSEERTGLTSSHTTYRTLLVFRRLKPSDAAPFAPRLLEGPQAGTDDAAGEGAAAPAAPETEAAATVKADPPLHSAPLGDNLGGNLGGNLGDNGVEDTAPPDPSLASAVRRRAALIGAAEDPEKS
ncbi:DUF4177 domain-containing protein [Litorivita sp. NS0012-18]|uniref:DUF4177 domain-containing protein n=1 Tax=Litorivita sp. NS0012-18 TaxID=3127655 RepID=UPI00310C2402